MSNENGTMSNKWEPLPFLKGFLTAQGGRTTEQEIEKLREVLKDQGIPGERIMGVFHRHEAEAETLLRKTVKAYPDDFNAHLYLTDLLETLGRYGEAEEAYREMT